MSALIHYNSHLIEQIDQLGLSCWGYNPWFPSINPNIDSDHPKSSDTQRAADV
jgi:hypothetical protein